jgi:hypothetical protein
VAGVSLTDLMKAAGGSLGLAQSTLTEGVAQPPTAMALSEATLEMKVAVDSVKGGSVLLSPVSSEDARTGALNVAALSTVTMRFMAFSAEPVGNIATPTPATDVPKGAGLSREEAIKRLSERADIKRLEPVVGPLTFVADFVASRESWLVSALDADGQTVRDSVIADKKG